jgi:electron transfer flavoprotein alpha subunit
MQTDGTEDKQMNADDLLYELEDFITASQHIPMTKLVVIEETKLFEYIDRIREMVVVSNAENMKVAATFQPQSGQHHTYTPAPSIESGTPEYASIVRIARQDAEEIRANADTYARHVLQDVQARLERLLGSVNSGLDELNR